MPLTTPTPHNSGAPTASRAEPLGVHELVDRVRTVLRLAAGESDPHVVSRDQFNVARHQLDVRVPTAQAVCKRLKRSWAEVIKMALGSVAERQGRGKKRSGNDVHRDCPDELIHTALRACAFAVGHVPAAHEFDAWVSDQAIRRERRGTIANPLPHSVTVIGRCGDWPAALLEAGVIEHRDQIDRHETLRTTRPVADLIDEFIDRVGILPTRHYFEDWCRRLDIPVGRDARDWTAAIAAAREARTRAGKATPDEMTMPRDAPALPDPVARSKRGTKGEIVWTEELILEALRHYKRQYLKGGRAATQKHYVACASGDPLLPASSTLTRKGKPLGRGFQDWCHEAGI